MKKNYSNKKSISMVKPLLLLVVLVVVFALTACGSAVPERLVGDWQCSDYSSGNKYDTSFYSLSLSKDGTFSLDNADTGKADLSGSMEGDDTGKIGILQLNCDKKNFNPPQPWHNLHKDSRIRYKIINDNTIKLGYVGIWLTFTK